MTEVTGESARTPRASTRWRAGVALVAVAAAGCGGFTRLDTAPGQGTRTFPLAATLRGQPIALHLAAPLQPRAPGVLVLYASGDGGWFGAAVDMFRAIGDAGFFAVGVSSRTLLHRASAGGHRPTLGELVEDYDAMLAQAAVALHLPRNTPVVLAGWSRGASLAVLVGGGPRTRSPVAGVIAIGLSADEDLQVGGDSDEDRDRPGPEAERGDLDLYALIDRVAPRRCAVIQATGDGFLPAAKARVLFGADTDVRRFFTVRASNHRFGGAGGAFVASLREALQWASAAPDSGAGE